MLPVLFSQGGTNYHLSVDSSNIMDSQYEVTIENTVTNLVDTLRFESNQKGLESAIGYIAEKMSNDAGLNNNPHRLYYYVYNVLSNGFHLASPKPHESFKLANEAARSNIDRTVIAFPAFAVPPALILNGSSRYGKVEG